MESVCNGRVAVVGNGQLSEDDRKAINTFDCVVRFNDMKNKRPEERCDVQVIRYAHHKFPGAHLNNGQPILPVVTSNRMLKNDALIGKHILPPLHVYEKLHRRHNELKNDARLFDTCDSCGDKCSHKKAHAGPSTGASVISFLENSPVVTSIDTFGMNWNGGTHHVDFKHPDIIEECCTKCVIHPTPSQSY